MRKVAFVIDGYFMQKRVQSLKLFYYDGKGIRDYCKKHLDSNNSDRIYRIFYYDTENFNYKGHNPISKKFIDFSKTDISIRKTVLLNSIRNTPNFALRLGKSVWQHKEWSLKQEVFKDLLDEKIKFKDIKEENVKPTIRQKMVDIKIGLDIALIAMKKLADVLIVITGDADFVPVLKFARREGMQVCLDPLGNPISNELNEHIDFKRTQIFLPEYKKS